MRFGYPLSLCMLIFAPPALAEPVRWAEDEGGNDRYYEYVSETLTWTAAQQAAAARRHRGVPGRLVIIDSKEQNDFVHALMPEGDHRAWIGLCDIKEEGDFRWVDGKRPTYTNWSPGEPNNAGEEDCGEMLPTGQWNDKENAPAAGDKPPQGYLVEYHAEHRLVAAGAQDDAAG